MKCAACGHENEFWKIYCEKCKAPLKKGAVNPALPAPSETGDSTIQVPPAPTAPAVIVNEILRPPPVTEVVPPAAISRMQRICLPFIGAIFAVAWNGVFLYLSRQNHTTETVISMTTLLVGAIGHYFGRKITLTASYNTGAKSGALAGILVGAINGTCVFPVIGTVIGAVIGLVLGFLCGLIMAAVVKLFRGEPA